MESPDLHLVIATEQNLANLIPALQCGAREVWVLQTPRMRANRAAAHLVSALKARGVKVELVEFADDDVSTLHEQAERVAQRVGDRALTINLTGGTKLMTLALVQTLAAHLETTPEARLRPHLLYCDSVHQRLDWLAPMACSEPMQPVLKIDDVLLVQGYRREDGSGGADTAKWQRDAQGRGDLTRWLGQKSREIDRFFGVLNGLAQRALPQGHAGPFHREQALDFAPARAPAELLERAAKAGLLHWDGDVEIVFGSPQATAYLGGGWVEEYAALKLAGARANGGWVPRLCIEQVDGKGDRKVQNELDAVLLHDNRLLVVECKAARVGEKTADWIYKLAQLTRQVGGMLATPLLLSARTLGDADKARAAEYGVRLLHGGELSTLPEWLRDWMQRK